MPPWTRTHDLHVEQWSCKSCHIFQIDHIGLFFYSLTACPNFDRVELNCFDSMLFCCCLLERCCLIIRLTFSGFFNVFEDRLIDWCVIIIVDQIVVASQSHHMAWITQHLGLPILQRLFKNKFVLVEAVSMHTCIWTNIERFFIYFPNYEILTTDAFLNNFVMIKVYELYSLLIRAWAWPKSPISALFNCSIFGFSFSKNGLSCNCSVCYTNFSLVCKWGCALAARNAVPATANF